MRHAKDRRARPPATRDRRARRRGRAHRDRHGRRGDEQRLAADSVLNYQVYVGGKGKAKANLAPVTIGYINSQGGPPNFNLPQATSVIRAGVKMVNAELGGIHGHPLRLSECFWPQAEEEGVRCGQQFVNDKT